MDEIIAQIARTIACLARLRILSLLAKAKERAPTGLARDLPMLISRVSAHLRRLSSVGLIQRRRSGKWCYCVPQSPYTEHAVSGKVAAWLFGLLKNPSQAVKDCALERAASTAEGGAEAALHGIIFEAATAFTNIRRLQLLRRLSKRDVVSSEALSQQLSMSESAISRHTAKLIRRGYVELARAQRPFGYRRARRLKTPIHARLLGIMRAHWGKT